MRENARFVRTRFERGNLIVEITKSAFMNEQAKRKTVRELRQIIRTYFGMRFLIRLSVVYAFTALFCASVALLLVM